MLKTVGQCLLCGGASSLRPAICHGCQIALPVIASQCQQCGIALPAGAPSLCGSCLNSPPAFDRCWTLGAYDFPLRELIGRFKFNEDFCAGTALSLLLAKRLKNAWHERPPQVLVPVPLHRIRLAQRGFNQSVHIARVLAHRLEIPVENALCRRTRNTRPQKGLTASERQRNLKAAFALPSPFPSFEHIAIVDDVVTTMNTVHEIAGLFKSRGVKRVDVVCLARVLDD